jgi:hypothetical protein
VKGCVRERERGGGGGGMSLLSSCADAASAQGWLESGEEYFESSLSSDDPFFYSAP